MNRIKTLATVIVAASLMLAACGGSDDDKSAAGESTSTTAAAGETGGIDPQPLAERTTVKLNITAPIELFAPLYLADALGEFEAENIDVEISNLRGPDAIGQIAAGNLDACTCAVSAGAANAVHSGVNFKLVSSVYEVGDPGMGLYARPEIAEDAPGSLEGKKIANSLGWTTITAKLLADWFEPADLTLADVEVVDLLPADGLVALENGGADAAYLAGPYATQAVERGVGVLLEGTQPLKDAVTLGIWFGKRLLQDEPEAGEALLRAIARTSQKYLEPGYRDNPDTVAAIAKALGTTPDVILSGPAPTFAPELAMPGWKESLEGLEAVWISLGGIVEFDKPIPAEEIIDEGPLAAALGKD